MAFKYDFDMFSIIPDEVRQEFQGMLNDIGMGAVGTEQKALFRDPALVEALASADEEVKQVFLDAGFGLNVYQSGAPEGRYPSHDEEARNACVRNLADNIAVSEGLNGADWGGFNLEDFLKYLTEAKPIDAIEMQAVSQTTQSPRKKKFALRLGLVAAAAMVTVSTVGLVVGAI